MTRTGSPGTTALLDHVGGVFGPLHRLVTVGFLPQRFRDELGFGWTRRQQTVFNLVIEGLIVLDRLPAPIRQFPFNLCYWDFRRRMRTGRPFV